MAAKPQRTSKPLWVVEVAAAKNALARVVARYPIIQRGDQHADPGARLDAEQHVHEVAERAEDEEAERETISPPLAA